jgi:hypothetical protein
LTIYLGLHVFATVGTLAAVVAVQGIMPTEIVATVASMILGYFQSQFLAAWMVLASNLPIVRWGAGSLAMLGVLAPPWIAGTLADGAAWFTLKIVAGSILLPAACVAAGLAPELFGGRRIRFVGSERKVAASPPQFSLRAMFVAVVLTALLIGLAQLFPLEVSGGDQVVSFSASILAMPAAVVAATYLLLPHRIWWLIPAPVLAGFLAASVTTGAEYGGFSVDLLTAGAGGAAASAIPIVHFLILRACGYRLIGMDRSPSRDG